MIIFIVYIIQLRTCQRLRKIVKIAIRYAAYSYAVTDVTFKNLRIVVFCLGAENTEVPEEKLSEQGEKQQQTQSTYIHLIQKRLLWALAIGHWEAIVWATKTTKCFA